MLHVQETEHIEPGLKQNIDSENNYHEVVIHLATHNSKSALLLQAKNQSYKVGSGSKNSILLPQHVLRLESGFHLGKDHSEMYEL